MSIKSKLITCGIICFILIGSLIFIFVGSLMQVQIDEDLVGCISKQATLYTQNGCLFCEKQKKLFGGSYENLSYIDCTKEENLYNCTHTDLRATPTWVLNNGTSLIGVYEIKELKEMFKC